MTLASLLYLGTNNIDMQLLDISSESLFRQISSPWLMSLRAVAIHPGTCSRRSSTLTCHRHKIIWINGNCSTRPGHIYWYLHYSWEHNMHWDAGSVWGRSTRPGWCDIETVDPLFYSTESKFTVKITLKKCICKLTLLPIPSRICLWRYVTRHRE